MNLDFLSSNTLRKQRMVKRFPQAQNKTKLLTKTQKVWLTNWYSDYNQTKVNFVRFNLKGKTLQ